MFFKNPISAPSKPAVQLPKLTTPNASELATKFKPQPASQALLKPGQSSSEYVHALQQNKQSTDAVNALAHGMPERDSVHWACLSSQKVAGKLNTSDKSALVAAQNWVKNPNPSTQAAAQAAASKTNYTGPGAWAAQAAAWSKGGSAASGATAAGATAAPSAAAAAAPSLTGSAVSGSVHLAAGLVNRPAMPEMTVPKMPAAQVPTAQVPAIKTPSVIAPGVQAPQSAVPNTDAQVKMLNPFIDLGKEVAGGKIAYPA